MKSLIVRFFAPTLVGLSLLLELPSAQEQPRAEITTQEIPGVVAGGVKAEILVDGLRGSEGLIPAPDGTLLVSEGRSNRIIRISRNGQRSAYLEPSNHAGTLAYDAKGRLISAERGGEGARPQLGVLAPIRVPLADSFEGRPFTLMNDLAADSKGGAYFTESGAPVDPAAGLDSPRKGHGIYYFSPDQRLMRLSAADNIGFPSGVILSPDEKTVYLSDLNSETLWAYDVMTNGSIANPRIFGKLKGQAGVSPRADGLSVDAAGRVYATSMAGVEVFSPRGEHLGIIAMSPRPQNVVFAGPDKKELYVLAGASVVYRIPMQAQGLAGRAK